MKAGRDIELGMGGGMVGYREPESKDQTYIMLLLLLQLANLHLSMM